MYPLNPHCDPHYLLWWLLSPGFNDLAIQHQGRTVLPKINQEALYRIPTPIPPQIEQRRIASGLNASFEHSERAREELSRIPRLVARYKQAILTAAFRGKLTENWRVTRSAPIEPASSLVKRTAPPIQPRGGREASKQVIEGVAALSVNNPGTPVPPGWTRIPLIRIARQETGHTPSRSHPEWWGGDIPWIGIKDANAHHGRVINETLQTTNAEGLANSSARLLPAGTVCLSRTASVGYVVMMGRGMATSQDFVTWTCSEAVLPKFLMYALMAEGDEIRRFGKGSTHTTIYFPEVRALQICLPPIDEQHEIVGRIEAAFKRVDRSFTGAIRAKSLLDRLNDATLAKAFRGELVPRDQ
jgi:type I restriction enzyme S subunit